LFPFTMRKYPCNMTEILMKRAVALTVTDQVTDEMLINVRLYCSVP